jgi:signal transduction histidine kinase
VSQDQFGLFDTPPDRRQVRFSVAIVGLLFASHLAILPVRELWLGEVDAFIPMIDAITFVGDLITATLLFAQATVFRSHALTILGAGYVYSALLVIPHALTFPGAFSANGLLAAGVNSSAWAAFFRRTGFPIAVMAYAWMKRSDAGAQPGTDRWAPRIGVGLLSAIALAAAVTLLTTAGHSWLPPFFRTRADMVYPNGVVYELITLSLLIAATVVVFRSRTSVLDMWLLVAFSAWMIQSLMIFTLRQRFTAGWYWLYALVLFSHLVVLLALIAESNRLYARLALAMSAHNRERADRLLSLDAVAAAIAHEIGQPLTAVNLHARAALNRLTGAQPDVKMAIRSLRATLEAGRRTTEVVKSVRGIFALRPEPPTEFSLNELVRTTTSLMSRDLAAHKVSLELELDEALPPILADQVQIQRVLVNLLTNAIESLSATRGRARRIVIRSTPVDGHDVLLDVSDNGIGIAPEQMTQIFDAFFTTKATGAGLGLSLCSNTVESLGGNLWASRGEKHGATLHMQLPRSGVFEPAVAPQARAGSAV